MSADRLRGHVIAAAAVAALCVGAGVVTVIAPWPTVAREPVSVSAVPQPEASLLACTGPVVALGRDATNAAARSDAAAQSVTAASAAGHADPVQSRLAAPDVGGGAGPVALRAEPEQRERTDVAAAGSATVASDDLAGFAASACAPALMESWLAAGSAGTGAADLLVLANPGEVAAQVEVTVFGAEGEQQPTVGQSLVVPAGTQRILPLASLALGEMSPVIRVTSSETPVQAAVQASMTRTLVPTGLDQAGVTAAPWTTQVIPSFPVTQTAAAGDSQPRTILRLLAPWAATDATVTITPAGSDSPVQTTTVPLLAGVPLELTLSDLPVGDYAVRVSAGEGVVAGMWAATGVDAGDDFAWYAAPTELGVPSLVAVADGPDPELTLTNDGPVEVSVAVAAGAGDGSPTEVTIPVGGSRRMPVTPGETYAVTPAGEGVRGEITFAGSGRLASYSVIPADAAASALLVYTQ